MSILTLTSDTLAGTPATGNIEYNGQFYGTDSNASRAQMQRITQGTAVASTSGTSIDFTSIPAWVKRITVMFSGVSTNGTGALQVQIGSSSYTTSGYSSYQSSIDGASTNSFSAPTTGFVAKPTLAAASTYNGTMVINLLTGNTWVFTSSTAASNGLSTVGNGFLALGGTLDRVRVIGSATGSPADTFDAGTINILYEG